jgi:hypothetical protein
MNQLRYKIDMYGNVSVKPLVQLSYNNNFFFLMKDREAKQFLCVRELVGGERA